MIAEDVFYYMSNEKIYRDCTQQYLRNIQLLWLGVQSGATKLYMRGALDTYYL